MACNRWFGKLRQRMSDKLSIHAAVAIKLFFKGENYQCLIDILAKQAYPSLAPRPKLWADVIDHRNAAFVHLPGDSPIERWRVDNDCHVRLTPISLGDQLMK